MSCADSASKLPTLCCRMLGAYSIGGCWGSATCSAGIFRGQEDSTLVQLRAVLGISRGRRTTCPRIFPGAGGLYLACCGACSIGGYCGSDMSSARAFQGQEEVDSNFLSMAMPLRAEDRRTRPPSRLQQCWGCTSSGEVESVYTTITVKFLAMSNNKIQTTLPISRGRRTLPVVLECMQYWRMLGRRRWTLTFSRWRCRYVQRTRPPSRLHAVLGMHFIRGGRIFVHHHHC